MTDRVDEKSTGGKVSEIKGQVLERSVMYTLCDFSTKIEMVLERRAMSLELK